MVTKFSKLVGTACDAAQIPECIAQIEQLMALTTNNHTFLDAIDNDITCILVCANRKCRRFNDSPWSPTLSTAYLVPETQ